MDTVVYRILFVNPRTGDILQYPKDEPYSVYAERYFHRRRQNFVYMTPPGYILQPKRMVLKTAAIKKRFLILGENQ